MNQVFLFFKVLELLADMLCFSFHIAGSIHFEEPLPHNSIFCGTFAGYLLIAIIRLIRLLTGQRTLLHPELFIDASGMLMHFICALLSMYYAECDFHLMFMGSNEELEHAFFGYCKKQSIACIIAGAIYLIQSVLLLDFIVKTPPNEDQKPMLIVTEPPVWDTAIDDLNIEERDKLARSTANVYFLGRRIDHWLCVKSKWFRQLAGGQQLKTIELPGAIESSMHDSDSSEVSYQRHITFMHVQKSEHKDTTTSRTSIASSIDSEVLKEDEETESNTNVRR